MNMKMLQHSVLSVIWTYPKKEREREKKCIFQYIIQITQFKIKDQYNLLPLSDLLTLGLFIGE